MKRESDAAMALAALRPGQIGYEEAKQRYERLPTIGAYVAHLRDQFTKDSK